MSFAHQLDRLRKAVSARQRGMREGTVVVQQSDLRELLYHFDRIEADYRSISTDPRPAAQPGAVKAIRDVLAVFEGTIENGSETEYGDRCLLGQAKAELSALAAPVSQEPVVADRIAEVIAEESANGAACGWKSCSGCHEANEGAETGFYPYSKTFGCYVGSGCSECGGLGVVWEHWDKAALDAMARDVASPQPLTEGEPSEAEVERVSRAIYRAYTIAQNGRFADPDRFDLSDVNFDEWWETNADMPLSGPGFVNLWTACARAALLAAKSKGGQADG